MTGAKHTFGIVGGYGQLGEVAARELLRSTPGRVMIGGRDIKKAQSLTDKLGNRAIPRQLDILDQTALDEFCRECDVVINCAGPVSVVMDKVALAAMRQKCHYVDPGGYATLANQLEGLQDELRKQGLVFLLSAGWIPGLCETFVFYADAIAAAEMDQVDSVHLYYGDRNEWSETGLRDILWHATHYVKSGLGIYRDGSWVQRSILNSVKVAHLPDPFGRQRAFLQYSQQLHGFGQTRKYKEVTCHLTSMSLPTGVLMFAVQALKLKESLATRVVRAAFRNEYRRHGKGGSLLVLVKGMRKGKPCLLTAKLLENRHYWISGLVPALAARLIAEKRVTKTGNHFLCDSVEPRLFMEELGKGGVKFDLEFAQMENGGY